MSDKTLVTPILGVCAYGSGMGKTTLLLKLIPELISRGLCISVVKHAHHRFDIDHPGKDSYRLREAGAAQMMIGSSRRWALMTELAEVPDTAQVEPELADLLVHMDTELADLILVEGFRHAPIAKIEVYRAALGMPLLALEDPSIIAVATDSPVAATQPQLDINDVSAIASYVMQWLADSHNINNS